MRWPIVLLAACGRISFEPLGDGSVDGALPAVIYATDTNSLYSIDPVSLTETRLVTLARVDTVPVVACDLAVDRTGTIIVAEVNFPEIYRVDPATGACSVIQLSVNTEMYGLTFVPPGVLDPMRDVLVGGGADSNLYTIDPATGIATLIGAMGARPRGDIVWTGSELVMSVPGVTNDLLYRIDIASGAGTQIGVTGVIKSFGMARVGGTLFAFLGNGGVVTVDPATAQTLPVASDTISWQAASAPDG